MERRDSVAEGEVDVEEEVEEVEMAVGRSFSVGEGGMSLAGVLGRSGRGGGWLEVELGSRWDKEDDATSVDSTTMEFSTGVAAAGGVLSSWKAEGSSEGEIPWILDPAPETSW